LYTVVRQVEVAADREHTWDCLTRAQLVEQWFADTSMLEPAAPFRFSFGDGDFFTGRVLEWEAPSTLRLEWRFMGLGPRFEITFLLTPLDARTTEVTVVDRGALSLEELHSLREGWQDFLGRLARFAATGERARYRWSETIGVGALLEGSRRPEEIDHPSWWRAVFPDAAVELQRLEGGEVLASFRDDRWEGRTTEALAAIAESPQGLYLGVTHRGWSALASEIQLDERRRYAGLWREALAGLELGHAAIRGRE
jgi:uncharacterized protein YndB with AHSA1/START domain